MTNATRDQRRQVLERIIGKTVAGKYTITGLLGFGGMGAVYEAVQSPMERKVALKLIPTYDATATTRFEREATTVSKLSHPNTVTVFDYGQTEDGHLYLSMEYLVGRTLTDFIREQGSLSAEQIVHIATQICRALGEAHRIGIIHRDIKPDNIFLIQVDRDPLYVKVLDFGIAKAVHGEVEADLTADGRIVGTPRYMSPEQILAQPIDHRVDIYSLGCILFEMACGAPPFGGNNTAALMMSHAQQPPPSFATRLAPDKLRTLPAGLEAVIQRTLAKNPASRPQNTEVLRHELEQALRINQAYAAGAGLQTGSNPQPNLPQHSNPSIRPPTGQFEPKSFEHHTGDFSHQTGNYQQQQHQMAQGFGPVTGTNTGFNTPPSQLTKKPNRTPLILVVLTLFIFGGLLAAYIIQDSKRSAQQPTPTPVAIDTTKQAPPEEPPAQDPPKEDKPAVEPKAAQLKFRVRAEPDADIFDGKTFVASTPHTISLEEGSEPKQYIIRLKDYKEEVITIDPSKPEDNFFEIKLVSTRSKKRANVSVRKDPDPPKEKPKTDTEPAVEPPKEKPKNTDIGRIKDDNNIVKRID